jgi:multidrug efflux pump subunit AcrA (membrane-fusion protein)
MQHLKQHDPRTGQPDEARRTDFARDISKAESHAVSTQYDPDTGRKLKRAAVIFAIVLGVGFLAVRIDRFFKDRAVAESARTTATAPHAVDTIEAKAVGAEQRFSLPGQTAAWHASTIYARVNGYVEKWFVDIGDRVHSGQVLALIETPDLDAELAGAQAQLKSADAQVLVRKAQADFAKTTYDRWRDSPKGVVSEQEREEKHADYDSSMANLTAAEAEVNLDQARVNQ